MRIAGFRFTPRLIPTVVYCLLLGFLLTLGFWQLERADQKRADLAARAAATQAPVLTLNQTDVSLDEARYRRARAFGAYDTDHQFLLDNQVENGDVGYRLLTPFKFKGSNQAVLVDRGFIALPDRREVMPELPAIDASGEVTGRLSSGPSVGMRLGAPTDTPGQWPRRVQYMDFAYMDSAVDYALANFVLVEGSLANDAVVRRSTRDAWRFGPERHEGYAFQWFALATALTIIWVGVNTKRDARGRQT